MDTRLENKQSETFGSPLGFQLALSALNRLPDHCALDVGELAARIGADKLELITWGRADIKFARLLASKVTK
ncbi:hypothetical protein JM946_07535 [Steroidobacter sp. S1-65]|uniref:Uncharacterized protein n=1 Tax=Steroidobacter gossypii TaxID=2805490 RepID=A0ABS1WUF7_9GAMM|nr:hypothetical protein [Steroidobacter gossypii]MBM0104594.1 hypothetical protein [Steroidobacter gossypii]